MKNLLFLFAFATILFACNSEKSTTTEDTTVEDLQKAVEDENVAELASYEYVCDHCKLGSHESGKCACGMDYKENADYKASADLVGFEYVCDHCKKGSHETGKCACGMEMAKNEEFMIGHSHEGHDHAEESTEES